MMSTDIFHEMPENVDLFQKQYEVKAGRWPQDYNECFLVLTTDGGISDFLLYALGLRDALELDEMIKKFMAEEAVEEPDILRFYAYEDFLGITFKLANRADYYEYDEAYGIWVDKSEDAAYMRDLVNAGEDIKIVGVVQPAEDATVSILRSGIGYSASLTKHVIEQTESRSIVKQQLAAPEVNVLTGNSFGEDNKKNGFQMESLFTVNGDALQEAFQFDQSALDFDLSGYCGLDSMDLVDMVDFRNMALELPEFLELPELNLMDIMEQLDVSVSPERTMQLVQNLLEGYQDYATEHPEADYSRLGESFQEYLQTPETQQRLQDSLEQIIQSNGAVTVSPEQLMLLVQDLVAAYLEYAAVHALPDPRNLGDSFSTYLNTPEAQQILIDGIYDLVNPEALQVQISNAIGSYMASTMESYSGAITQAIQTQISVLVQQIMSRMGTYMQSATQQAMDQIGTKIEGAFSFDPEAFMSAIEIGMGEEELTTLLRSLMSAESASYDNNLIRFGYANLDEPSEIDIYPRDFKSKAAVLEILDAYNSRMEAEGREEKVISYTDLIGTLMSTVTEIVDMISYVLVALVAISLVVSSIMICVVTYISVLERKKEIGILRAIGASKRNISQVFNAETFIIGFGAGLIGIGLTLLLLIPGNVLIHSLAGSTAINASLPVIAGIVLIALSVILTLIGGLLPSKKAAKSDPVAALRSD